VFGERYLFKDRADAAAKLASILIELKIEKPLVLGIPRGGVPIGRIIADALHAPMTVYVSRKIAGPSNPEFGIGAITEDGTYLLDSASVGWTNINHDAVEAILQAERRNCAASVIKYREGRPLPTIEGRMILLCDDGLATGMTMLAAVVALTKCNPAKIVVAVPVASRQAVQTLSDEGATVAACSIPADFKSVSRFYEFFDQLNDEDVIQSLHGLVLYNS